MNNEPKTIATWCGRPVEDLTREELVLALNFAAREVERLQQERRGFAPYIDHRAFLLGAKA